MFQLTIRPKIELPFLLLCIYFYFFLLCQGNKEIPFYEQNNCFKVIWPFITLPVPEQS